VTLDEPTRDEFLAIMNDAEKSPTERVQALVDLHMKAAQAASEASSKAWDDMQTSWRDEVKADKDIGGDKLQPALARIGRLVSEYGTPELNSVFDLTGVGNNIHLIKFLDKIGSKLVEGDAVTGQPTAPKADAASRLYPSMKG
jgi:hypothetical protein